MKKAKKLISLLLALTMLLSIIPMAMAAETTVNLGRTKLDDAILEKGTPSSFSHLRDMKDGSAAKGVGETGFWQRLPGNTVVGYSSDPKIDVTFMERECQKILRGNSFKATVKIFTRLDPFLERLDSMNAHKESLEEGIKFRPDEKYPELSRNELIKHTILAICL